MAITATDSGGTEFEQPPVGTHVARCYKMIDLGTQRVTWQGTEKWQRKVLIAWELPTELVEVEGQKKPHMVMARYTLSLSEKSTLAPLLESWRGQSFTAEERNGFDIEKIVGAPCMISLVKSECGRFTNVAAVMAMPKGVACPPAVNGVVIYSLETPDQAVFDGLSDKVKAIIQGSKEWAQKNAPAQPEFNDDIPPMTEDDLQDIPF